MTFKKWFLFLRRYSFGMLWKQSLIIPFFFCCSYWFACYRLCHCFISLLPDLIISEKNGHSTFRVSLYLSILPFIKIPLFSSSSLDLSVSQDYNTRNFLLLLFFYVIKSDFKVRSAIKRNQFNINSTQKTGPIAEHSLFAISKFVSFFFISLFFWFEQKMRINFIFAQLRRGWCAWLQREEKKWLRWHFTTAIRLNVFIFTWRIKCSMMLISYWIWIF